MACMEVTGNPAALGYRDVRRQHPVQRVAHLDQVDIVRRILSACNLAQRVHPSVGAAGRDSGHVALEELAQGILEIALNGSHIGLTSEASKGRAVVGKVDAKVHARWAPGPLLLFLLGDVSLRDPTGAYVMR